MLIYQHRTQSPPFNNDIILQISGANWCCLKAHVSSHVIALVFERVQNRVLGYIAIYTPILQGYKPYPVLLNALQSFASAPNLCDNYSKKIKRTLNLNRFYGKRIRGTLNLEFEKLETKTTSNKYNLLIGIRQPLATYYCGETKD